MTLDKIILFGIHIVGFLLSLKHFKYIGAKFREIVQSQLLRILLMIPMFCIAGYFQSKIKNSEVLSISTVIISLSYALFMGVCIRILYYKNSTN